VISTEPVAAPIETVTPLRPSEALRLGRLTRPRRAIGDFLVGNDGACALGAIATGAGASGVAESDIQKMLRDIYIRFPHLKDTAECPAPVHNIYLTHGPMPIANILLTLNDYHKWSDEQMCDWLDSIETS
jgi:hypothetical protein